MSKDSLFTQEPKDILWKIPKWPSHYWFSLPLSVKYVARCEIKPIDKCSSLEKKFNKNIVVIRHVTFNFICICNVGNFEGISGILSDFKILWIFSGYIIIDIARGWKSNILVSVAQTHAKMQQNLTIISFAYDDVS